MPLYEYKCGSCGKIFTKLQKFSDEPLTIHEECGMGPVERLISASAFHFKGTGWYATDYAKSGAPTPPVEKSDGSKSEGNSGESKSTDSKSGDTKSADSKSGDSKSGGSKPADSKSAETKASTDTGGSAKSNVKPAPSGS